MFTQSAMCESLLEELQRITRYASQVNATLPIHVYTISNV